MIFFNRANFEVKVEEAIKKINNTYSKFTNKKVSPTDIPKEAEKKLQYFRKKLIISRRINTHKIKNIFGDIYREYLLKDTTLLFPEIPSSDPNSYEIKSHSHQKEGYFNYLITNDIDIYSFKFFNSNKKYIIGHVDNTRYSALLEIGKIGPIYRQDTKMQI